VPKGEYFNLTGADTIVEVITNPSEMQTPYAFRTSVQHARANARLCAQKQERLRQILIEGFGRKIAILVPPLSGPVNLGLCALRDADLHAYLAVTTSKPRKHLFRGYRFSALGLGNRKEQIRFLFRRELKAAVIIFGENRHRRALLEGDALKNDLSANHFSSCHLHTPKNTPIQMRLRHDA
jgi:hypothetical protein